jgi:hypothetical protein
MQYWAARVVGRAVQGGMLTRSIVEPAQRLAQASVVSPSRWTKIRDEHHDVLPGLDTSRFRSVVSNRCLATSFTLFHNAWRIRTWE